MARTDQLVSVIYNSQYLPLLQKIEMFSMCSTNIFVIIYLIIITKKKFCHINLLVLLCIQPSLHAFGMSTRIFRYILQETDTLTSTSLYAINMMYDITVSVSFQSIAAIGFERIISLRYFEDYDNKFTSPTLSLAVMCILTIISIILIQMWYLEYLLPEVGFSLQNIIYMSGFLFFLKLHMMCRRHYTVVAAEREWNFERRYTTSQNLTASRLLLYCAPYKCISIVINLWIYYWIYECHNPFYYPFYSVFYFLCGHAQLLRQLLLTIRGHHLLREEFRKLFHLHNNSHPQVLTVTGELMIFNSKQKELDLYFQHLKNSWNEAEKTTRKGGNSR